MDCQADYVGGRVVLAGDLTIYSAAALKQPLLAALETVSADFQLDLTQVSEFDTAGLQLVLLAKRNAAEVGQPFRIAAASATVRDALELCGLAHLMSESATQEAA